VRPFEAALHAWVIDNRPELIDRVETAKNFDDALAADLKKAITEFKSDFTKDQAAA